MQAFLTLQGTLLKTKLLKLLKKELTNISKHLTNDTTNNRIKQINKRDILGNAS